MSNPRPPGGRFGRFPSFSPKKKQKLNKPSNHTKTNSSPSDSTSSSEKSSSTELAGDVSQLKFSNQNTQSSPRRKKVKLRRFSSNVGLTSGLSLTPRDKSSDSPTRHGKWIKKSSIGPNNPLENPQTSRNTPVPTLITFLNKDIRDTPLDFQLARFHPPKIPWKSAILSKLDTETSQQVKSLQIIHDHMQHLVDGSAQMTQKLLHAKDLQLAESKKQLELITHSYMSLSALYKQRVSLNQYALTSFNVNFQHITLKIAKLKQEKQLLVYQLGQLKVQNSLLNSKNHLNEKKIAVLTSEYLLLKKKLNAISIQYKLLLKGDSSSETIPIPEFLLSRSNTQQVIDQPYAENLPFSESLLHRYFHPDEFEHEYDSDTDEDINYASPFAVASNALRFGPSDNGSESQESVPQPNIESSSDSSEIQHPHANPDPSHISTPSSDSSPSNILVSQEDLNHDSDEDESGNENDGEIIHGSPFDEFPTPPFYSTVPGLQKSSKSSINPNEHLTPQQIKETTAFFGSWLLKWRLKRRLKIFFNSPAARPLNKRNAASLEIIQVERDYHHNIGTLNRHFRKGILQSKISLVDFQTLFGDIESICSVSTLLITQLEEEYMKWPSVCVGKIFYDIASSLRAYQPYIDRFDEITSLVRKLLKKNTNFSSIVSQLEKHPRAGQQDFESFLIMPVQQIPRYSMLLDTLLERTPESHNDFLWLKQAVSKMKDTVDYLNTSKILHEIRQKLLSLSRQLTGVPFGFFESPHRFFLTKLVAQVKFGGGGSDGWKTIQVFIFNDVFLFGPTSNILKSSTCPVFGMCYLYQLVVDSNPVEGNPNSFTISPLPLSIEEVSPSDSVKARRQIGHISEFESLFKGFEKNLSNQNKLTNTDITRRVLKYIDQQIQSYKDRGCSDGALAYITAINPHLSTPYLAIQQDIISSKSHLNFNVGVQRLQTQYSVSVKHATFLYNLLDLETLGRNRSASVSLASLSSHFVGALPINLETSLTFNDALERLEAYLSSVNNIQEPTEFSKIKSKMPPFINDCIDVMAHWCIENDYENEQDIYEWLCEFISQDMCDFLTSCIVRSISTMRSKQNIDQTLDSNSSISGILARIPDYRQISFKFKTSSERNLWIDLFRKISTTWTNFYNLFSNLDQNIETLHVLTVIDHFGPILRSKIQNLRPDQLGFEKRFKKSR